jgi:hypothetical protein
MLSFGKSRHAASRRVRQSGTEAPRTAGSANGREPSPYVEVCRGLERGALPPKWAALRRTIRWRMIVVSSAVRHVHHNQGGAE